jgi:predicted O-methyltransferase YrrM
MWPGSRNDVLKRIKNSAPGTKVNLVQSTSYEFLVNNKNKYDLIFIDGGHSYKTVKSDWELSSKLLSDQGVIFFDDFTSRNGAINSGFGISTVVEEIDTKVWNVKIFKNMDFFQKEWGILSLKIVKVKRA